MELIICEVIASRTKYSNVMFVVFVLHGAES